MYALPQYITALPPQQQAIWTRYVHTTGPGVAFTKAEIETSIAVRFEQQVQQYPDRLAVKTRTYTLTYADLNRLANRIAHAVLAQCDAVSQPVVLLLEKEALLIAALLAVLKAGQIYVPLDPALPGTRGQQMFEGMQAKLIVTNTMHMARARELAQPGCHVLNLDGLAPTLSEENPGLDITPDCLACIIYTSGSTGQPKGVVQNHRNILHSIMRHTNMLPVHTDDRLTLLSSISFVGAVRDTFSALLNGAALFPFDLQEEGMEALRHWLLCEEITMYRSVATVFRHFVSTLRGNEGFPSLRAIKLGSETLYPHDIELYKRHFSPNCLLYIGMGTTETGTATHHRIDKATQIIGSTVPAGYAVEDTEILILDEDGSEMGCNTVGEIAVKSRYVALGYWCQPNLTRTVFLPDPHGSDQRVYRTGDLGRLRPDGVLEHFGRKDLQVKVRGNRVEVAEIETALLTLGTVKEAVVTAQEMQPGEQRLVAYVVPAGASVLTSSELQRHLQNTLPAYMIPAVFVCLEALPHTPTGKVDRRALPAPPTAAALATAYVAPRTPVEALLARVWAELLGLERIGIHDHFLVMGGHSCWPYALLLGCVTCCEWIYPAGSPYSADCGGDGRVHCPTPGQHRRSRGVQGYLHNSGRG